MTIKWNVEYSAPLAGGQQVRVIGTVSDDMTRDQIFGVFDEMDYHVMRLRERHEIPAMEEKQSQMERSLEELQNQRAALMDQGLKYNSRERMPTNIQNGLDGLEKQIPVMEENLKLIADMIAKRKADTASVLKDGMVVSAIVAANDPAPAPAPVADAPAASGVSVLSSDSVKGP